MDVNSLRNINGASAKLSAAKVKIELFFLMDRNDFYVLFVELDSADLADYHHMVLVE